MEQPHRVRGSRRYFALNSGFARLVHNSGVSNIAMKAAAKIAQEINASDKEAGGKNAFRARPIHRTVTAGWENRRREGAAVVMDSYYRAAYGQTVSNAVNSQSIGGKKMKPRHPKRKAKE